jgi:hypothetical protein
MQVIDLNTFDLILVSGPDARKFLQGQVTCDLEQLSSEHSLTGSICNLKGRVISDFRLVEHNGECYLLMAAGMAAIVLPVLSKYIVFSKAECRLATETLQRTGFIGGEAEADLSQRFSGIPPAAGDVIATDCELLLRIPGSTPRFEHWQFNAAGEPPASRLAGLSTDTSSNSWELEDIKAGIVHITPDLSEQQLPEALNYDLSGIINFRKGCYTGQEIIARMYYRGTAKKRLYHGVAAKQNAKPGSIECEIDAGQEALSGEILRCAQDSQRDWHVLAILPVAVEEETSRVYLDRDPQALVTLQSLPYRAGRD